MGVFKLDLMTLLVIFVVLSVVFTMTAGSSDKEQQTSNPVQSAPHAPTGIGNSKVSSASSSNSMFASNPVVIPQSKFSNPTWN